MKPLTAIILVWGVAYFAKVSGHLEFSWTAFLLPLCVLFFLWVAFAKTLTYAMEKATDEVKATTKKLQVQKRALEDAMDRVKNR